MRCLTHISHRYFAPGRSLLISSPASYRDVQTELITATQKTSIWPVVVTVDGNISIPKNSDFINTDGSYIILIPDGNISSLAAEISGLGIESFRYTRLWNSEARFVVAGANEFSMSQQKAIFHFFSKLRIYNCIIVSRQHYEIDKEISRPIKVNDVETDRKLGMYTWFPYKSKDRCTEVGDITLLDSWVISAQENFTKNTDLFPGKMSKSFRRCPMKAVVLNGHSYFTTNYVYYKDSNGNIGKYIEGVEYDLLKIILEQMNMTLFHVSTPEGFENEGSSEVKNLGLDMYGKEIDIALGNFGTHCLVDSFFDITNIYYMMRIRWYVPCSDKYPRWSSIFRVLSVELWLLLIILIVTAAISITLVGRYTCMSEWQGYKTLISSLINVWAVFLGVSVSTMPRAASLRSLFLAWVCFSLAFSTVFQVFLTTFLIDSGYKTPIQNMDELFASGIKLVYPPSYSFVFEKGDEKEASNVNRSTANCPSFDVCVDWAKYQKNVSILLLDKVADDNYARGNFVGENSEPLLCRLEDGVVYSYGQAMVMFHGDPLLKRINEIIDRVVEAGLYNYWISLKMNLRKIFSRKIAIVHPLDGYYSFKLYHMQPAFYLLLMGWCISALCFMVEFLYDRALNKGKCILNLFSC